MTFHVFFGLLPVRTLWLWDQPTEIDPSGGEHQDLWEFRGASVVTMKICESKATNNNPRKKITHQMKNGRILSYLFEPPDHINTLLQPFIHYMIIVEKQFPNTEPLKRLSSQPIWGNLIC